MRSSSDTSVGRRPLSSLFTTLNARLRKTRLLSRRRMARRRTSLVRRFQTLLMAWGLLIYVMAVAGFWFASSGVIKSTFEQHAEEWVPRISHIATPFLVSGSADSREEISDYLRSYSEVSYVRLYDANDMRLLSQYVRTGYREAASALLAGDQLQQLSIADLRSGKVSSMQAGDGQNLLRVIAPVTVNTGDASSLDQQSRSRVLGYLDMGINFTSYRDRLARNVLVGSVVISFIFLLAAIVGRQLITNALKPLLDLQQPLERLAKGEMDFLVHREGDEEIVAISRALNSTISAIKGRDAELRRLADFDELTGLINKRSFNNILDSERRRIARGNDTSALFFIDLDQFKYINDTLGHTAGDRLLVQVAELLKSRMRSDDVVCRLGGDEFAVLAKSVDKEGAIEIASGLVKSMYEFMFLEQGKAFNIYCSIGIALMENDGYTTEEVFARADMACYTAKAQGRNRFKFFDPESDEVSKIDIGWSHRIGHALANDEFVLHYQPIFGVTSDLTPSFEILVRMRGDSGELIPPNMFIPVAERFGLATEIDYWIIATAMSMLDEYNRQGRKIRFYVNLSGQLLEDPEFVDRVLDLSEHVEIDPGQMVFELTERAAVGNIQAASEKMEILRAHGFLFAVDDFGSGFSSFSYLKHMPVEFVKIEGEFVERLVEDEVDRALVKSMVEIAKACGKRVVAEYVCDQRTLEELKGFGIDYAQGFYLSEPLAEVEFTDFYASANGDFSVPGRVQPTPIKG